MARTSGSSSAMRTVGRDCFGTGADSSDPPRIGIDLAARQAYAHHRTLAQRALDIESTARLPDVAERRAETQARTLAMGLGREEGVQRLAAHLVRHAHARVADRDLDI